MTKNLKQAITGKIRLPSLQDYNVFVTWESYRYIYKGENKDRKTAILLGFSEGIRNIDALESLPLGRKGGQKQTNNKRYNIKGTYIVDRDKNTGAIYTSHSEIHYFIRHFQLFLFGIPVHLAGLLGMTIIDIAGLIYSVSTTLKALWHLDWHESATNGYQCLLRIASIGIKPLQWFGLVWSNMLGIIHSRSGSKLYASLERGAYKEAFLASDFQPLTEKNGYIGETPVRSFTQGLLSDKQSEPMCKLLCKSGARPHYPKITSAQENTA